MFHEVIEFSSLRTNGVNGITTPFTYEASPTNGSWGGDDIAAHITPIKTAGAPDVPATFPSYWNSESNAYCSVGGSVSGNCAPASG